MPITPLHLGLLAPINHWFPNKVSNLSFLLVTLWMDTNAIMYYVFGLEIPAELHGPESHSLLSALLIAGIVSVFVWRWSWILGAFLGGVTHILLDGLVHSEMLPFYPIEGNPFYLGAMLPLSLALSIPLVWLIAQYVSGALGWIQKDRAARQQERS